MERFVESFQKELLNTIFKLNNEKIIRIIKELKNIKKRGGRLFFLGVGGSAANCSHAVNDFRKLCNLECYAPTDNISEITARTNDEGFSTIFINYLKISSLNKKDAIMIFSVGGGNKKNNISVNLIEAIKYAKLKKAKVFSITSRREGFAFKNSDIGIFVDINNKKFLTPISETVQSYIWHLMVTSEFLQVNNTKW